jgi:hypothetical protein
MNTRTHSKVKNKQIYVSNLMLGFTFVLRLRINNDYHNTFVLVLRHTEDIHVL